MILETLPINGTEKKESLENQELNALSKFYKAFNTGDIELMEQCWLNTDEISMDNPIGGIRRGWDEIKGGYVKIFSGKAKVYVEFYDYSIHSSGNMLFATGRERGYFRNKGIEIPLAIRTTRIFTKIDQQWKQIHHHGSIDKPESLRMYQEAILNNE